jgi:hypothetical protein
MDAFSGAQDLFSLPGNFLLPGGEFSLGQRGGMLYFNANVMRLDCFGFVLLLFVDCLVESRCRFRFLLVASRRWVVLRILKIIHRIFLLFYETSAIP